MAMRFFLPRQLVFFKSDQQLSYYKLKFRWDGSFSLEEQQNLIADKPFVLLLDTSLPFRRKFQFSIQQRVKKEFILASAAGLFPFPLDDYSCGLGRKDDESYLFALKNSDYEAITAVVGQPAAVVVSDFDKSAMTSSLQSWMSNRTVYALNSVLFPIEPQKFLASCLSGFLLIALLFAWSSWATYFEEDESLNHEQVEQITKKAMPLLHKRLVIAHMQSAHKAFDKLLETSPEQLLRRLTTIINGLPENCYIDEVKFESGKLEVSGWGTVPGNWFAEHGIAENNYQVTDLPKIDRFTFWMSESE